MSDVELRSLERAAAGGDVEARRRLLELATGSGNAELALVASLDEAVSRRVAGVSSIVADQASCRLALAACVRSGGRVRWAKSFRRGGIYGLAMVARAEEGWLAFGLAWAALHSPYREIAEEAPETTDELPLVFFGVGLRPWAMAPERWAALVAMPGFVSTPHDATEENVSPFGAARADVAARWASITP